MRKKKIQILLSAAAFLFLMGGTMPSVAQERKIGRVERRADRNFIRQKFDKAMAQYGCSAFAGTSPQSRSHLPG